MLLFGSGQMIMEGFKRGLESKYGDIQKSLYTFTGLVSADARRGVAEVITTTEGMWEKVASVSRAGGSGLPMTPTQFKSASGAPISDYYVADQIQASLAANPNASAGGYEGPVPMGAQYGPGISPLSVSVPVYLDGDVIGRAVQKFAARDLMRGGAGVPG